MYALTRSTSRNRFFGASGPSFALDFVNGTNALDPRVTFTRASTATYFNSAGTLTSAAVDAPRFDYDPSTLAAQGLLIEESRTNSIRNNTMVGAVAGTPGTLPTSGAAAWFVSAAAGLATNVIGTGVSAGITYIDVQLVGTATAGTYVLEFEASTGVSGSVGQTWANSFWLAQVGGTTNNISNPAVRIQYRDAASVILATSSLATATLSGTLTRSQFTSTAPASTAFVRSAIQLSTAAGAVDITLRIGLPQLEQGAFATSVIPTTTTALTRAADLASVNTLSPWFNATEGTLYVEGQLATGINPAIPSALVSLDDTTLSNRMQLRRQTPGTVGDFRFVSSGGNFVGTATVGTLTGINKQAAAYAVSDQAGVINGTLMTGITPIATLPTITRLALGDGPGSVPLNGYLRRVTFYPLAFSLAELQTITA